MRRAVIELSLVALEPAVVGLFLFWVGSRNNYAGACIGVCVESVLALISLGVALVAVAPALAAVIVAGVMILRAPDWPALFLLLGGVLASASGAVYVLQAQRTALIQAGDAGARINTGLVAVAVLAPLALVPLLTLLYGTLTQRHTIQRVLMGGLAVILLALPLAAAPP